MDFRKQVPFGRTGLAVSRMGLASGYGAPAAAIEKAFHEYGVNYFYLSLVKRARMVRAIRNLVPQHRDEIRIVLAKPTFGGFFLRSFVDRVHRLKESGKVRFVGMSGHDRPLFGKIARGELEAPVDFFQIRYNAVHRGAEKDIFPHLPRENRPGIVIFTATCWRKLLKPKLMPAGESPLAPADCYRFVLSHPDVDVCVTGPSTAAQMEENLRALSAGPLDDREMTRIRRIGDHIYETSGIPPPLAR